MSSLSSASTNAQVWASFDDNASFEENASPSQAASFITACVILLRRRPTQITADQQTVQFDPFAVRAELTRARRWLASNRTSNADATRFMDFSGIRD